MKRLAALLTVLFAAVALSISVFAAETAKTPMSTGWVNDLGDRYELKCKVKASQLSGSNLAYWKKCMAAFTHSSDESLGIVFTNLGDLGFFVYTPSDIKLDWSGGCCTISAISTKGVFLATISSSGNLAFSSGNVLPMLYPNHGQYFFFGYPELRSFWTTSDYDAIYVDWDKPFQILDDLGESVVDPEPEPDEPDPPSSSSTGGWVPPVVSDPEIPVGDEYVFYDTKILSGFLKYVRDAIGKSMNVGWLIFGFILMWLVIKKVIKSFASR